MSYTSRNTYETLNRLTDKTKHVWLVFHGIGYLSRFFLRYFNELSAEENYIIAPQAPSKYYLNNQYKHVGASWLTKEDTLAETQNNIHYINSVLQNENLPSHLPIIVFGYSQGVSIATRFIAKTSFKCNKLVLYAGSIPKDVRAQDVAFLQSNKTEIVSIYGISDPFFTKERVLEEKANLSNVFSNKTYFITFNGGHDLRKEMINQLVQ